jgi:ABC-type transporter Mla subunit MlaD
MTNNMNPADLNKISSSIRAAINTAEDAIQGLEAMEYIGPAFADLVTANSMLHSAKTKLFELTQKAKEEQS